VHMFVHVCKEYASMEEKSRRGRERERWVAKRERERKGPESKHGLMSYTPGTK
jgi:hypothetical protein